MAQKPQMLKDYLELDASSEKSESFRWARLQRTGGTTIRCLLNTERAGADRGERQSARASSKDVLSRISPGIRAKNILQFAAGSVSDRGSLMSSLFTRSISKKLRHIFCKRSCQDKEDGSRLMRRVTMNMDSICPPSRLVNGSGIPFVSGDDSNCADSANGVRESPWSNSEPDMSPSLSPQKGTFVGVEENSSTASTCSRDTKTKEGCSKAKDCSCQENKEQFSPVSVMEFPCVGENEDREELEHPTPTNACLLQSFSKMNSTNCHQLRYQSIAELYKVDLDRQFACAYVPVESTVHLACDGEGERRPKEAGAFFCQFVDDKHFPVCNEKLPFDFFDQRLSLVGDYWRKKGSAGEEDPMHACSVSVSEDGYASEDGRKVAVGEIGWTQKWGRFEMGGEKMVAAEVAGCLLTWVVEELVDELVFII